MVRKRVDGYAFAVMMAVCLVWGSQQVAIKFIASEIAPVWQITLRSVLSTALVALYAWRAGHFALTPRGTVAAGACVGLLFGLEFVLIGEGLKYASASRVVVFLYTAPLFAALGLHLRVPEERLRPAQWLGVVAAFAGIAVAFQGHDGAGGSGWVGDLLALAAGAVWGLTTIVVRGSALTTIPASVTLLYQLAGACVVPLLYVLASAQPIGTPGPMAWGIVLLQAVVVSFASYLVWFSLLRRYQAAQLGVLTFMTPMFGVLMGAWLLGETLDAAFVAGAMLVAAGVLTVSLGGARR